MKGWKNTEQTKNKRGHKVFSTIEEVYSRK